ncbi:MAG: M20/M25/M40 family metallo-hydrolase, partial [Candidatus Dormibacteraeota bacterium]|nr:M20/M25/M40 family metallo-hydrolase [Candidatus Dormibacteraeota bacterium]
MSEIAAEVTDLLQRLIRNGCINDGTPDSGQEIRSTELLADHLHGCGVEMTTFESLPGRASLLARLEGTDPAAPTLMLMGHTDVVPVDPEGWRRDPLGGELVDGVVWGRGAIDMLNLTASMAVATRRLATSGWRPRGTLLFLAVADEEAGGALGAGWLAEHEREAIRADYVITENGGVLQHT